MTTAPSLPSASEITSTIAYFANQRGEATPAVTEAGNPIYDEEDTPEDKAFAYVHGDDAPEAEGDERAPAALKVARKIRSLGLSKADARPYVEEWSDLRCRPKLDAAEFQTAIDAAYADNITNARAEGASVGGGGKQPPAAPRAAAATAPRSKRDWALAAAADGFSVFPCIPNGKIPAITGWRKLATSEAARIKAWWTQNPDYNIGISTQDLLVVDVDPRNGGDDTFALSKLTDDWPETREVRTPSGGSHFYFRLPESVRLKGGAHVLGQGVDVRAAGNLVVGPGSTIDGVEYTLVRDVRMALTPQWMRDKTKAPRPKSASAGKRLVEEDDESIERAQKYIDDHVTDIEKGNRNTKLFEIGAALYDFGVSKETCHAMLADVNSDHCFPPLEDDEIAQIADSALRNRDNAIGVQHSANTSGFEAVEIDARETASAAPVSNSLATPFRFRDPATIPPVPWIIPGLTARRAVTTVAGPGGVSKSTWALHVAVAVAAGRNEICGFPIPKRQRVWYWGQEDDIDQMEIRVAAIMQAFNVSRADMEDEQGRPMLYLNSGRGRGKRIELARRVGDSVLPGKDLDSVVQSALAVDAALVILDPLISFHQSPENVNEQMRAVYDHLADIANDANCGILAVCHTGKPDKASSQGFAGDAYATGRNPVATKNTASHELHQTLMDK